MTSNPASNFVVLAACPLCQANDISALLIAEDMHYGIPGEYEYERCNACSLVFLNPMPTEAFLAQCYQDDYYSYQDYSERPLWKRALGTLLFFDIRATGDPKFLSPGRILDIGCGSGEFLWRMKRKGWETCGVEISRKAAEFGNARHDLNIHCGTVLDALFRERWFDYVRLNHAFEHLVNPHPVLEKIGSIMKHDGVLFIGVPNIEGTAAKLFGKYWWNLGAPVHPYNYTFSSLTRMLRMHGFNVIERRTNSNFAGIVGSAQIFLNARRHVKKDSGNVFTNPFLKVLGQWVAKASDVFQRGDCLEIIARRAA